MEIEIGSIGLHFVENSLWKRLRVYVIIIIIIIIIIIMLLLYLVTGFRPGTSLEPAVTPTAQASSFTLQYFPYYV
jgi:hypothetical protein